MKVVSFIFFFTLTIFSIFSSLINASEIIEVRDEKVLFSLNSDEHVAVGDEVDIFEGTVIVGKGKISKVGKRSALVVISQQDKPIMRGMKVKVEELSKRINEDSKSSKSDFKKNIYRDCGIGAMLFDETKWAAVSSNIIWDLGLSASSSYSSSEDQCAGKEVSMANFINQNYVHLEEETVTGEGSHLVTMLNILGCDVQVHENIIKSLRDDFAKNVRKPEYATQTLQQKSQSYFNQIFENKDIKNCAAI